jgi:pyruvate formate lyase activating enzyme
MTGLIFSIERYALEDGPGIRTLLFLKGCPLHCLWCANPESQAYAPQILYFQNKCASCGRCIEECPQDAIFVDDTFGLITDPDRCTLCSKCIDVCFYGARELSGREMEVHEVMEIVERDKMFYEFTGGGVTISGGEPLLQSKFVNELTSRCKEKGIHTAVETTLYGDPEIVKRTLEFIDLIFVDIKHIDSELHFKYTGVRNERILSNIRMVDELGKTLIIRIPFIPGVNSDDNTQREIYTWVSQLKNLTCVEVLPYHRLGMTKYKGLSRYYEMEDLEPVQKQSLSYLKEIGAECGVTVRIGAK